VHFLADKLWNDDVKHHMQAEEQYVSPHLKKVNTQYDNMVRRDHETIRLLAERINVSENGYTVYNVFAKLLEQHIRFEERVVFNKVQEQLTEPELFQLEASLHSLSAKKCTDYPVKFWE
jgi:hemerythrin superfamily protein